MDGFGITFAINSIFAYRRGFPQFIHIKNDYLRTDSSTHLSTGNLSL